MIDENNNVLNREGGIIYYSKNIDFEEDVD